ncbi:hypothetical protein Mal64_17680 [Pseudobythopirellula maris]|uniref:Uncharacterized protein n=1 Tax=Pseudobythopirellula maris TaxID=2527991 RepID=A0A5C5ZLK9_9BACT|nr:hypothetical protein [Pseudobythopirellula maris]TWT88289.1 hypothetical protein Mal64_17680 [Pseudobythopirellula maris]
MRTLTLTLATLLTLAAARPAEAQFWKRLIPGGADEPAAAAPDADFSLSQEDGPWLIMATTFSGEGAEQQAIELCREMRESFRLEAYVHDMTFDYSEEEQVGRGIDEYGAPIKMRYRRGEKQHEWAVLVGDYPDVEDPIAQKHLNQIKKLQPEALKMGADGETSQNYAHIRRMQEMVLKRKGVGPMRTAFMTRNPLLPKEYFVPKGVDKFVAKMNKGMKHSLLKADGKYTIKVATFRGRGVLQGASGGMSEQDQDDSLVEAAENAHLLCEAMRDKGWEAYEFHDRQQSYVTVGSFDTVDKQAAGTPIDQIRSLQQLRNEAVEIVQTFGAAYDTPSAPLEKRRRSMADRARAEEVVQGFNKVFTSEMGQVAAGLNPKFAMVDDGARRGGRPIPFDIHPLVIEAPRESVSGAFAWRR